MTDAVTKKLKEIQNQLKESAEKFLFEPINKVTEHCNYGSIRFCDKTIFLENLNLLSLCAFCKEMVLGVKYTVMIHGEDVGEVEFCSDEVIFTKILYMPHLSTEYIEMTFKVE